MSEKKEGLLQINVILNASVKVLALPVRLHIRGFDIIYQML